MKENQSLRAIWALVLSLVLGGCVSAGSAPEDSLPLGALPILQGATSAGVTELGVTEPPKARYVYRVRDLGTGQEYLPQRTTAFAPKGMSGRQVTLRFVGLNAGGRYGFYVHAQGLKGAPGDVVDFRRFKTLDPEARHVVLMAASCMDDFYKKEQRIMWAQVAADKPRALFLMGDNVYADRENGKYTGPAGPAGMLRRYQETRRALDLFRWRDLVPVFSMWDDHDVGTDDANRNYPYLKESMEIFNAFFPRAPIEGTFEEGPGSARLLKAFGQRFVLMDSRSFRSPDGMKGPGQTHLGKAQVDWIFERLGKETTPTWLVLGDQFFGGYHKFESWEGDHPEDFKAFVARVRALPAPVFLVSGDRHLTELLGLEKEVFGYPTYEFTTSAIHAIVFPSSWDKWPSPRKLEGVANTMYYGIIETEVDGDRWDLKVTAKGPGTILYERQLSVRR